MVMTLKSVATVIPMTMTLEGASIFYKDFFEVWYCSKFSLPVLEINITSCCNVLLRDGSMPVLGVGVECREPML